MPYIEALACIVKDKLDDKKRLLYTDNKTVWTVIYRDFLIFRTTE